MTRRRHPLLFTFTVLLLTAGWSPAFAQNGTITGAVRDTLGDVVPGVTIVATNQATKAVQSATTGIDGRYSLALPAGVYTVTASLSGFRPVTQSVEVAAGGTSQLDFTLQAALSEEVTVTATKREETVLDVPFSVAAPTEEVLRARGVEDIEGVAANVGGLHRAEPRPRPEPGGDARRLRRPDRPRPAGREGAGRRLPRRVGHLALAVHARPRPVRHQPRRGAARPAGHAVRLGLAVGHGPLHHQPAGARRHEGVRRARVQRRRRRQRRRQRARSAFNVPLGETAALRVAATTTASPGYIDAVQPDLSVDENVNDGFRSGRAGGRDVRPERAPDDHAAPRLPERRHGRLEPHRRPSTSSPTRSRPRGRRSRSASAQQFTQLEEEFTDDFVLADLNLSYNFGDLPLTSITSYTLPRRPGRPRRDRADRQHHRRHASACRRTSTRSMRRWTMRPRRPPSGPRSCASRAATSGCRWVAGGFFSHTDRDYGQDLPVTGFEDRSPASPPQALRAPKDSLFFSDLGYELNQFALFGEATVPLTDERSTSPPACATTTSTRTRSRSSTASSATTTPARRSCRSPAPPTPAAWRRGSSRATSCRTSPT